MSETSDYSSRAQSRIDAQYPRCSVADAAASGDASAAEPATMTGDITPSVDWEIDWLRSSASPIMP